MSSSNEWHVSIPTNDYVSSLLLKSILASYYYQPKEYARPSTVSFNTEPALANAFHFTGEVVEETQIVSKLKFSATCPVEMAILLKITGKTKYILVTENGDRFVKKNLTNNYN